MQDLAEAMAQVIGNEKAKRQIYNIQVIMRVCDTNSSNYLPCLKDQKSVSFESLAKLCAIAMNKDPAVVKFYYYDKKRFDFGKKKAFPFRDQHFFCSGNIDILCSHNI